MLKMVGLVVGLVLVLVAVSTSTSKAASFTNNGYSILLEGTVERGDADKLESMVVATGIKTVRLNSPGGDASEGFRLGYRIKKLELTAVVPDDAFCMSSCAIAFLGSPSKVLGGILGFHVAYSPANKLTENEGLKYGQRLGAINSAYFFNMGYTVQLQYLVTLLTDKDTFLVVTTDDLAMFTMKENNFTRFAELPAKWASDRIAGPLRLSLIKGGY